LIASPPKKQEKAEIMIKRMGYTVSSSSEDDDDWGDEGDVDMEKLSDLDEDNIDKELELKDVDTELAAKSGTTSNVQLGRERAKLHKQQEKQKQELLSIIDKNAIHKNERPRKTRYINKQRTLIFASRGINQRMRHFMNDLRVLIPHSKSESKFDNKRDISSIKEICVERSCNNCIFFEARRNTHLYLWFSRCPNGPSMKFFVSSVHTMNELKLTGNCLNGSRPILTFDKKFDSMGIQFKLMKELFMQIFGTPAGHPRSKPFIDRTMSFMILDHKIWVRNYQIVYDKDNEEADPVLVEIGPRFVLHPVRITQGAFTGSTIYQDEHFVNPNAERRAIKKQSQMKSALRSGIQRIISQQRKEVIDKHANEVFDSNPMNDVFEKGLDFGKAKKGKSKK